VTKERAVESMSISEFARRSRLSPRALRLYDELGLLAPARVDAATGYRFYTADQVETARLIAALRQLGVPLAEIKGVLGLEPALAADRVTGYWSAVETEHAARRELADAVVRQLHGKRSVMFEAATREIPSRSLLCLKRHVAGETGAWALGKEFVRLLQERAAPRLEGQDGAAFCIYWGEVSDDSDGPLEWCRPVPAADAAELAGQFPELTLRTEPAHREAFVDLGPGGQTNAAQWQLVWQSLSAWGEEHGVQPTDLGARVTYRAPQPRTADSVPDTDFAVPFADRTG
jgi:DNA-binding transcriptional MerR regulator